VSIRVELGAGSSECDMASAEASSKRRVKRVKTEWTRKVRMRTLMTIKITRPRRILIGGGCDLEVRSTAEAEDEGEGRRGRTSAPRKSQNRLRREGE
jgi:hypothetical protein